MTDLFRLFGGYETTPQTGAQASGDPQVNATLDERLTIDNKTQINIVLDSDDPHDVPLGGLESVHVLIMRAVGGKVTVTVSSDDGDDQVFPVDPLLIVESRSVPFTAISLSRVTGIPTTVKVFMAEKPL
jgi:hypothetical protein